MKRTLRAATPHRRRALLSVPKVTPLVSTRAGLALEGARRALARHDGRVNVQAVRRIGAVQLPAVMSPADWDAARALAACGVILIGAHRHPLIPVLEAAPGSAFDAEVAAVAVRRAAWRPQVTGVPVTAFVCSSRPDRVPGIVAQLARQDHPNLQVVVMLHGAPTEAVSWGDQPRPEHLVIASISADAPFGEAASAAARLSEGVVVTKIDDDDYYGPSHVTDLLVAREHSAAECVGKALQYVYIAPIEVATRNNCAGPTSSPERFGSWVAGGTLTLDRTVGDELGWFDPIPRSIDRNLQDKVLAAGGRIYRTHGLGYLYVRHDDGHTWVTDWARYLSGAADQRPGPWPHAEFGTAPVLQLRRQDAALGAWAANVPAVTA